MALDALHESVYDSEMNVHAQTLGRLGKGKRKTMSKAALEQRRNAALGRKHLLENKAKSHAQGLVNRMLQRGELVRGNCAVCNAPDAHAHHEDYSKPLDIVWLCRTHHEERHKTLRNGLAKNDPSISNRYSKT